jgi:alkanesulfonate monooxygenase SsuD/methylene tetrahydromethanopterin reductase-like flavin-dependent oxidoreductase (luciferase family)
MLLNIMLEGQMDLAYEDLLAVAQQAAELGYEGLYRSDHYALPDGDEAMASTDAWATLAGLARDTDTILLGTLVSPATFRAAGNLAKVVATVAEMAGTVGGRSRIELGMGTGWMESEHRHYGFAFPDLATRYRRLDEHLQIVRGLWDPAKDPFTFDGEFEQLAGARFRPVPDPPPRIIVGGRGLRKTPRLAVRHADELNTVHATVEHCTRTRAALDEACAEQGRDPGDIDLSLMTGFIVGRTDAEVRERAAAIGRATGNDAPADALLDRVGESWLVGTPSQIAERIEEYREAGVRRIMLQHFVAGDHGALALVADEVRPQLRGGQR